MKISEDEFRDLLEKTKVPVVVDFYADWCAPCRGFEPMFKKVSAKLQPQFSFCKVNIEEAEALVEELGVDVVPTVMVFNNSKMLAQHAGGFSGEKELEAFIQAAIK